MRLLNIVEAFLREDGWDYSQFESKNVLKTGYQGQNGSWTCYAQTREDDQQFLFYTAVSSPRVVGYHRGAR